MKYLRDAATITDYVRGLFTEISRKSSKHAISIMEKQCSAYL